MPVFSNPTANTKSHFQELPQPIVPLCKMAPTKKTKLNSFEKGKRNKWIKQTCLKGKCLKSAKAIVTAGLKCAPEICPTE